MRASSNRQDVSLALSAAMLVSSNASAQEVTCKREHADLELASDALIKCLQQDAACAAERESVESARNRADECDQNVWDEFKRVESTRPPLSAYELGWQTGARADVQSWERGAFWAGCLGGPPGCVVATGAAAATHEGPAFLPPEFTEKERRDFAAGYADRLRQKRLEASVRKGTQGTLGLLWIPLGVGVIVAGSCTFGSCPTFGIQLGHGRAFRIEEEPVLPELVSLAVREERRDAREAGAAWLNAARSEAASVPAFRRLAAELAIVGAPQELVARTLVAAADEERHAALCFRAASALTGKEYLALPMPRESRWKHPTPDAFATIAREAWTDGCLSEGTAALVTEEASRTSRVKWARELNGVLAFEEARHAELAWSILEWCWRTREPAAASVIESAAIGALDDAPAAEADDDERRWFGQPSVAEWSRARERVASRNIKRVRRLIANYSSNQYLPGSVTDPLPDRSCPSKGKP